jgi:hypothetical protein
MPSLSLDTRTNGLSASVVHVPVEIELPVTVIMMPW